MGRACREATVSIVSSAVYKCTPLTACPKFCKENNFCKLQSSTDRDSIGGGGSLGSHYTLMPCTHRSLTGSQIYLCSERLQRPRRTNGCNGLATRMAATGLAARTIASRDPQTQRQPCRIKLIAQLLTGQCNARVTPVVVSLRAVVQRLGRDQNSA